MAHYKRKRPRTSPTHGFHNRRDPLHFQYWGHNWPRWWDVVFHTRPRRRRDKELTRAVKAGLIDADNTVWSVDKKPQVYYW